MSVKTGVDRDIIEEYFLINNADNIPNNFSIDVNSLNSYYEKFGEMTKIKEISNEVKSKITELNDTPEEYKQVLELYNLSIEDIGIALNPDGSLQSFNDSRKQLTSDIVNKYKRIEVIIPIED